MHVESEISGEVPERTAEQILHDVAVTPEQLQGQTVLFFGDESKEVAKGLPSATVRGYFEDIYLATDELVPEGTELTYIFGIKSPVFNGDLGDSQFVELLAAAVRSLSENGQIRIAQPLVDPEADKEETEYYFTEALADRGLYVAVSYHEKDETYEPYLVID